MRRMHIYGGGLLATLGLLAAMAAPSTAGVKLPDPALDDTPAATKGNATLVLAGGCFWGIEEVYQHVRGVVDVVSGYAGGSARTASYDMVSTGTSGHAESVKITYDPSKVTLGTLLKVFFSVAHDPTLLNRQGPDVGPQYRSAIFYSGDRQQQLVKSYIVQLNSARVFKSPIVTQLVPLTAFYKAEEDHQDYAVKNPFNRYILINDKPKVDDLKREFPALFK
jgi:peptide-methionine (S)-S-oxide reductase